MQVSVVGGGSWGTTVASLVAQRHPTMIWARNARVAEEIRDHQTNEAYLPGFRTNGRRRATSDLEEAVVHAELLIVGVPTAGVRSTMEQAEKWIHPWIPVV